MIDASPPTEPARPIGRLNLALRERAARGEAAWLSLDGRWLGAEPADDPAACVCLGADALRGLNGLGGPDGPLHAGYAQPAWAVFELRVRLAAASGSTLPLGCEPGLAPGPADAADHRLFLDRWMRGFPGSGDSTPRAARLAAVSGGPDGPVSAWVRGPGLAASGLKPARELLAAALVRLAAEGHEAVALYGGGGHTAGAAAALVDPPVRVVAVVDDAAAALRPGRPWSEAPRFLGYPRLRPAALLRPPAGEFVPDAVVLCSDKHEAALWERAEPLRAAGLAVEPLYDPTLAEQPAE